MKNNAPYTLRQHDAGGVNEVDLDFQMRKKLKGKGMKVDVTKIRCCDGDQTTMRNSWSVPNCSWLTLGAATAFTLALSAQAASFDCAKASGNVEHIICDNSEISKLDEELDALYKIALQDSTRAGATRFSQKQWIQKWRNQFWCKDAACVKESYEVRIKHLQESNSAAQSAPEWSKERSKGADEGTGDSRGEHILIRASSYKGDNSVCQRFKDNLNRFRKIDFDQCNPRISDQFPEFSRPQWKEIPFDMALAEKAIRSKLDYTYDGSNDPEFYEYTRKEREQRWQQWLKGSAPFREAGQAHMWVTKIDMDGDGQEDTILRMTPAGGRYPLDPKRPSRWTCDYNIGELYVIESANPKMAALFNLHSDGSDIIRYAEDGHFYLVDWHIASSLGSGWNRNDPLPPSIGGTRGVIISKLHQRSPSYPIGTPPICLIDWVPTGHFIPPPESEKGRIER